MVTLLLGGDCILTDIGVSDAVHKIIDIIPMWLPEHILVCDPKAVLQSHTGLLTPPPHCPCGDRLLLNCRDKLKGYVDQGDK